MADRVCPGCGELTEEFSVVQGVSLCADCALRLADACVVPYGVCGVLTAVWQASASVFSALRESDGEYIALPWVIMVCRFRVGQIGLTMQPLDFVRLLQVVERLPSLQAQLSAAWRFGGGAHECYALLVGNLSCREIIGV